MLTSVRLQNFKAVHDSGRITLDAFNVFIGRNGSGKSSVIEAVELLSNCIETDLPTAIAPFRRGRDLIRGWERDTNAEARISLSFDPEDVSAGDIVNYELGFQAPSEDEVVFSHEKLMVQAGEISTEIIRTEAASRFYRVPPTRLKGAVKGQRRKSPTNIVGERESSEWIKLNDHTAPAIKHVDKSFSQGGYSLRAFLDQAVTLRLVPSAIAEFAPRHRRRSRKILDPAGYQTAELIAALSDSARLSLIDKLRFVTSGFSDLLSHRPKGPADQRYFFVVEDAEGQSVEIPAWVLSEGTRRLTSILALTLQEEPLSLISIEEVENGFDPWTLKFVLEELVACTELGTQIMATTHSPYLMNLLPRQVFTFVSRLRSASFSKVKGAKGTNRVLDDLGVGDAYTGGLVGSNLR
jgi:predicted ATPase